MTIACRARLVDFNLCSVVLCYVMFERERVVLRDSIGVKWFIIAIVDFVQG